MSKENTAVDQPVDTNSCCGEGGSVGVGEACGCQSQAHKHKPSDSSVSRRSFIQTLGVSAAAGAITTAVDQQTADAAPLNEVDSPTIIGPGETSITLHINGNAMKASIDPATTLMEVLRWHLDLTGTKEVCDRGACGACSVLVDGALVNSCMMLALDAVGTKITTVEGIATNGELDPIQDAFIKHDALQCGFCTPGLIMATKSLLNEKPKPTLDDIKHGLSGNICRCGAYTNIFNAVLEASGQQPINDADMAAKGGA